jgi:hypothetical protein
MDLAVVDMEIERPVVGKYTVGILQPRLREAEKVVENIAVLPGADLLRLVPPPLKADAITVLGPSRLDLAPLLKLSSIEWRIDINQVR